MRLLIQYITDNKILTIELPDKSTLQTGRCPAAEEKQSTVQKLTEIATLSRQEVRQEMYT